MPRRFERVVSPEPERRSSSSLPIASLLCLVLPLAAWAFPDGPEGVRARQLGYVMAGAGWLWVWLRLRRGALPGWRWALAVSLLARALLLSGPPSDDVSRYVWEGRVRVAGHNPYVVAPDDPALAALRDAHGARLNHPDHPAIYPPLFQALCVGLVALGADEYGFKLALGLADLATIWLLRRWLIARGARPELVLLYALCPLVLVSFSLEGHADALLALCLAGWLERCDRRAEQVRPRDLLLGGLWLGAGIGFKLLPVVLVPWLLVRAARSPGRVARRAGAVAAAGIAAGLPALLAAAFYLDAGPAALFAPLWRFGSEYANLDLARDALRLLMSDAGVAWVCAAGVLGAALLAAQQRAPYAAGLAIGCAIVLAPTIHPWYFAPLATSACALRGVVWPTLVVTLVLAYEGDYAAAATGSWAMPGWVAFAVFVPPAIALVLDGLRSKSVRGSPR